MTNNQPKQLFNQVIIQVRSFWLDEILEKDQPMRIGVSWYNHVLSKNKTKKQPSTRTWNPILNLLEEQYCLLSGFIDDYIQNEFEKLRRNQPLLIAPEKSKLESLHFSMVENENVPVWSWNYRLRTVIRQAIKHLIAMNNRPYKVKVIDAPLRIQSILDKSYKMHLSRIAMFTRDDWFLHLQNQIGQRHWDCLLPHQKQSVAFAVFNSGKILLADDMGLGKTLQSITIAHYFRGDGPVLIVCPSSVKSTWQHELLSFEFVSLATHQQEILVCDSGDKLKIDWSTLLSYRYVIISFHLLETLRKVYQNNKVSSSIQKDNNFATIIIDESHNIMNGDTQRSMWLSPFLKESKHRILSSGTPEDKPKQLYNQWNAIQSGVFTDFTEFGKRYCNPTEKYIPGKGTITVYDGYSNLEELFAMLRMTFFIRRTKDQALKGQMPSKTRSCIYLDEILPIRKETKTQSSDDEENWNATDFDLDSAETEITDPHDKTAEGVPNKTIYRTLCDNARRKKSAVIKTINHWWHAVGCRFEANDRQNKVILFAQHRLMLNALEQMVQQWTFQDKPVQYIRICGSVLGAKRPTLIYQFQHNDQCRVAILAIRAAGMGLNLQSANYVIFTEMDPTYKHNIQGEERAYRLGQRLPVQVMYLLINEPIERNLWNKVCEQSEQAGITLNGQSRKARIENETSRIFCQSAQVAIPLKRSRQNSKDEIQLSSKALPPIKRKKQKLNNP